MSPLFADTAFFIAYLNPRDDQHQTAYQYMVHTPDPVTTTTWVLAEVGNFLAGGPNRALFVPLVRSLRIERRFTIIEADESSFARGIRLYGEREDKAWSVTDCISFAVMKARRIRKALTTDHHFAQAGFEILLR